LLRDARVIVRPIIFVSLYSIRVIEGTPLSNTFIETFGFVLNNDASLIEPTMIEAEKVLNGLIQSLRVD